MKKKNNESSSVVKVDASLLEKVEEFISREENRLKFVNKKQFVDLAIQNYLKNQEVKNEKSK